MKAAGQARLIMKRFLDEKTGLALASRSLI